MNVLISATRILPLKGGIENSINAIGEELTNKGHDVTVIASDILPMGLTTSLPIDNKKKYTIIRYKKKKSKGWLQLSSTIKQLISIWRIDKKKYDLVICRDVESAFICFIKHRSGRCLYIAPSCTYKQNMKRILKDKENISIFSYLYNRYWYLPALSILERLVLVLSSKVCAWSTYTLNDLHSSYTGTNFKSMQVNPGVCLNRFKFKQEKKKSKVPGVRLVMICRLDPLKNIDDAIKAVRTCNDSITLDVYGGGDRESERLEDLCSELGVVGQVKFMGETEFPEKVYPLYDYMLMLSTYEPFGQTNIESMACGTPVIGYKRCDEFENSLDNIITDTVDGFIIDPSVKALSEKLRDLSKIPQEEKNRMQVCARKKIKNKFQWGNTVKDLLS